MKEDYSKWYLRQHKGIRQSTRLSLFEAIGLYRDLIRTKRVSKNGAAANRLRELTHKLTSYTAYQAMPKEERLQSENPLKI
jgi:hypothetical protein